MINMLRYEPGTSRIRNTIVVIYSAASFVRRNALGDVVPRVVLGTIIVTSIYHTVKNVMTEIDLLQSN